MMLRIKYIYIFFIPLISLLFLVFVDPIFSTSQVKRTEYELNQTKRIIQQKTLEKQQYIYQQRKVSYELKKLEQELKKINAEKKDIENKINQTKIYIASLEKNLDILSTDINFYKRLLSIGLNKYVETYILTTPLIEDNFYRRVKKDILLAYSSQIRSIETKMKTVASLKREYDEKKKKLNLYYNALLAKDKQQRALFIKKGQLLNEYKTKQKKIESEIEELKKTQKELEALLKKLKEKQKQHFVIAKKQEGQIDRKFIKPINGEVISKFGKELKAKDGSCIVRNGVVIQGLSDANVVCVEDGKVLFVSNNFRSYGKIVIVEHKNDIHTVYAQLGEIFVNENMNVTKNQIIGKTNSSGQVYFELRKNFVPVDPELYFE